MTNRQDILELAARAEALGIRAAKGATSDAPWAEQHCVRNMAYAANCLTVAAALKARAHTKGEE